MKVLVSACLVGRNCKYNGGNNYNEKLAAFLEDKEVIEVCPEVLAGLPVPRTSVELVHGVPYDADGRNLEEALSAGVKAALKQIEGTDIDLAVLQSRSPTCGVNQIYDGSFTRTLIKGQGLLAAALCSAGYRVMDLEDFEKYYDAKEI